jgi:hypothetical protein
LLKFAEVAICVVTFMGMCVVVDHLEFSKLVEETEVTLHNPLLISFFISELPVVTVNNNKIREYVITCSVQGYNVTLPDVFPARQFAQSEQ